MDLFDSLVGMTLLGGILIGGALGALTLFTGRIMSGSAMIGSLLGGAEGVAATSIAFIGGVAAASFVLSALDVAATEIVDTSLPLLITGGLLAGVSARAGGASLGAVMTGIARRAPRSFVMFFVILGGATAGGIIRVLIGAGGSA